MAPYAKLAAGSFVTAASPVTQVINLPFQPQRVRLRNTTAYSAPAQNAVTYAEWDVNMASGTAIIEYISAASSPWVTSADFVASLGISTFSAGLSLQFGNQLQIASTTKGATTTITTASAHGLSTGAVVILEGLYQTATTGMPQMSNMPFIITVTSTTAFTVNWNSNNASYTNLSGSPTGAFVRQVLYPWLYLPGQNFISAIGLGGTNVTITTTSNHNYVAGQIIAFHIPSAWGITGGLNEAPNTTRPGFPQYFHVTAVNSNTQFTCTQLSANVVGTFSTAVAVTAVPGLQLPQVVAVGDINSGGALYSGGATFYPSPSFPTFSGGVSTINGPAIQGAFVNNTSQGFSIGLGTGTVNTSALLLTASSTYIWEALFYDLGS